MALNVYILTWCNRIENLYGTTLIFKTLRVGFPTAEIHIVDNASLLEVRPILSQYAQDCGAQFTQLEQGIAHHDFIENILLTQASGDAIFIDPDICFWESVEGWSFNKALMAGRLISQFNCPISSCITHPRLHTSFLWIPDVGCLLDQVWALRTQYFESHPFRPIMYRVDGVWQRFDTTGVLYNAIPELMHAFSDKELDAYDHIFCGTHLELATAKLQTSHAKLFVDLHHQAQTDYTKVKGVWRMQSDFFNSLAV